MKYTATAPCRIDLAGGTLDLNPVYLFLPKPCTVNLAISIGAQISVEEISGDTSYAELEDLGISFQLEVKNPGDIPPGSELVAAILKHFHSRGLGAVKVTTRSFSPQGAGLAASSTLCVALTATLAKMTGLQLTTNAFVQLCLDLEASILKTPAGYQDFYPAFKGGLQEIRFFPGEIKHQTLNVDLSEIHKRFSLVYTGKPHHSGLNNWQVFKSVIEGNDKITNGLAEIGIIADSLSLALQENKFDQVSLLLKEEWEQRKHLSSVISTPMIDSIVAKAEKLGGSGKVCGAGGGGCVIVCHDGEAKTKTALETAVKETGADILPWSPATAGCVIIKE